MVYKYDKRQTYQTSAAKEVVVLNSINFATLSSR